MPGINIMDLPYEIRFEIYRKTREDCHFNYDSINFRLDPYWLKLAYSVGYCDALKLNYNDYYKFFPDADVIPAAAHAEI